MGALQAAVSGLNVHRTMLDVAGNNLANVNTIGFKASTTQFSELLSQTMKKASGPSGNLGGVNPQQMGTGVGIATINRDMSQGNFVSTGQALDVAVSGAGYFVLNNAQQQSLYTRMGSFTVDEANNLVDGATGYKVQRTGTYGAQFQGTGTDITIPFGAPMQASATTTLNINGNLRSEVPSTITDAAVKNVVTADQAYTISGSPVTSATPLTNAIDQMTGAFTGNGTIAVTGVMKDGTAVTAQTFTITTGDTMKEILDGISAEFTGTTARLNTSGQIFLTDDTAGYSQTILATLAYTPSGGGETFAMPVNYTLTTAGGNDTHTFTRDVYDAMGAKHSLTGTLVKTDTANTWDLVIPEIAGETEASSSYSSRRIPGIQFEADGGAYNGLADSSTSLIFTVTFANNPSVSQDITLDFGTIGEFDGITQFATTSSTAAVSTQDGYAAGVLTEVSINNSGMVIGKFTNDKTLTIAALQLAIFQNPGALEATGGGYFAASANSGIPAATIAGENGAGSLETGQLEQSNTDVAREFVNMMQAQNGFQANARTIRVANDILRELTNLIR